MCFLLQDALHVEWKMDSEFIMQIHSKKKRNKVKHLLITPCCSVLEAQPLIFSWLILAQLSLFHPWKALNKASGKAAPAGPTGTLTRAIAWSKVFVLLICTVGWWGVCLSSWQSCVCCCNVCSLSRRGVSWVFYKQEELLPAAIRSCSVLVCWSGWSSVVVRLQVLSWRSQCNISQTQKYCLQEHWELRPLML